LRLICSHAMFGVVASSCSCLCCTGALSFHFSVSPAFPFSCIVSIVVLTLLLGTVPGFSAEHHTSHHLSSPHRTAPHLPSTYSQAFRQGYPAYGEAATTTLEVGFEDMPKSCRLLCSEDSCRNDGFGAQQLNITRSLHQLLWPGFFTL